MRRLTRRPVAELPAQVVTRDIAVDALGVLGNLELYERMGVDTQPYFVAAGLTWAQMRGGVAVSWDVFARFADQAQEQIESYEPARQLTELGPELIAVQRPPSTRHALTMTAAFAQTLLPSVTITFHDVGPGFLVARTAIGEGLFVPRRFHEHNAYAVAGFPRAFSLGTPHLLELRTDAAARVGEYLYTLPDEPLAVGTLRGDERPSPAAIHLLHVALAHLGARGLLRDASWGSLASKLAAALRDTSLETLRVLAREALPPRSPTGTLASSLDALHAELDWGCFVTEVRHLDAVRILVRLRGLEGCVIAPALLALYAGALDAIARDTAPANVTLDVSWALDEDARGASFLVAQRGHLSADQMPPRPVVPERYLLDGALDALSTRRLLARTSVVERLGVALARGLEVNELAHVVTQELLDLGADGVAFSIEGAEPEPFHARGHMAGEPLVRTLEARGNVLGRLSLWVSVGKTGPMLAGLDVIVPWVAAALDSVLERAETSSREALRERTSIAERVELAAARWSLTARQQEVLGLLVKGLSNKEIAVELACAVVTVENHITAIFRRAEVTGRSQLFMAVLG